MCCTSQVIVIWSFLKVVRFQISVIRLFILITNNLCLSLKRSVPCNAVDFAFDEVKSPPNCLFVVKWFCYLFEHDQMFVSVCGFTFLLSPCLKRRCGGGFRHLLKNQPWTDLSCLSDSFTSDSATYHCVRGNYKSREFCVRRLGDRSCLQWKAMFHHLFDEAEHGE